MKIPCVVMVVAGFAALIGCVPNAAADDAGSAKTKPCFNCNGTGELPCPNGKDGQMDCPGPCLKLSKGEWVHLDMQGHLPTDLWRKFSKADGGWQAWNQYHVGEVIEYQNGDPVNIGKCKICGGTGKVKCTVCDGAGELACPICDGKKVVPEFWTAFDNPKLKNRPSRFKLKDGRTLIGYKMMVIGNSVTIRTQNGNVEMKKGDIVSEEKPPKQ